MKDRIKEEIKEIEENYGQLKTALAALKLVEWLIENQSKKEKNKNFPPIFMGAQILDKFNSFIGEA